MCIITYVFDELCCFYAAAMLLVLLCIILAFSDVGISFVWLWCHLCFHVVEEEQEI
jgi:hypothetical protein